MAAIEKVCEVSGDYPGHLMYGYKKNHIQICSKYRKLFAKPPHHVLLVFEEEAFGVNRYYGCPSRLRNYAREELNEVICDNGQYYIDTGFGHWLYQKAHKTKAYVYILYVPSIPGEVCGQYMNDCDSSSFGKVKRKLKRMLKVRKLNICKSSISYSEFSDMNMDERALFINTSYQTTYCKEIC